MLFKRKKKKIVKRKVTKKKKGAKKKAFGGYKIHPDAKLGAIIGKTAITPAQMTKKIWTYIKKHKLGRK